MDTCTGVPTAGSGNGALIKCARNVTAERVVKEGEVSTFTSDCGFSEEYTLDSILQRYNITFEVSKWSPQLEALLNGLPLLDDGDGTNIGFVEEGNLGCSAPAPDPRFYVELFYRILQCDPGAAVQYKRVLIPNVRFAPTESDKEGQIGVTRFKGMSQPVLTSGIGDGPYNDIPASVVADLAALVLANPNHTTVGLPFYDTQITSPTNDTTLLANTCYMATVPAQV